VAPGRSLLPPLVFGHVVPATTPPDVTPVIDLDGWLRRVQDGKDCMSPNISFSVLALFQIKLARAVGQAQC
jgi:hypothetical protein